VLHSVHVTQSRQPGGGFLLRVEPELLVPAGGDSGVLTAELPAVRGAAAMRQVQLPGPGSAVSPALEIAVPAGRVKLWWPVGYGEQPLYDLVVRYTPSSSGAAAAASGNATGAEGAAAGGVSAATRRVGFRTIELVEKPLAEAAEELVGGAGGGWDNSVAPGGGTRACAGQWNCGQYGWVDGKTWTFVSEPLARSEANDPVTGFDFPGAYPNSSFPGGDNPWWAAPRRGVRPLIRPEEGCGASMGLWQAANAPRGCAEVAAPPTHPLAHPPTMPTATRLHRRPPLPLRWNQKLGVWTGWGNHSLAKRIEGESMFFKARITFLGGKGFVCGGTSLWSGVGGGSAHLGKARTLVSEGAGQQRPRQGVEQGPTPPRLAAAARRSRRRHRRQHRPAPPPLRTPQVNGVPVYAKGANIIPFSTVPINATRETIAATVDLALDSRMNMLRVWGGGYYMPDAFYDLADEKGIMVRGPHFLSGRRRGLHAAAGNGFGLPRARASFPDTSSCPATPADLAGDDVRLRLVPPRRQVHFRGFGRGRTVVREGSCKIATRS
jgi:hypothetical protein